MPVPDFSPGEVLTAAAMDSISSWKLADVDFTASALVEIENVFSANYDHYEIIVTNIGSLAAATDFKFHTATATPTTASDYARYGWYYSAGGAFTNFFSASDSKVFLSNHGTTSGNISSCVLKVINPYLNTSRTHTYVKSFDANSGLFIDHITQWLANTRFTGFRIVPTSGTITGNVQVRGWRA